MRRSFFVFFAGAIILGIAGCGGSSSGGNHIAGGSNNVAAIIVDSGPALLAALSPPLSYVNGAFVSVTVCDPTATTSCQTIDHVLVDTGSMGLRLLSSTGGGEFNLSLPQETDNAGNPLSECAEFVANVNYGSVRLANVQIAGEKAGNVPIQIIGDLSTVPGSCSSIASVQDDLPTLQANGILGVGFFPDDCGAGCATSSSGNPEIYYSCPASGCVATALASESLEVANPVVLFPTDNNGVIVELPAISSPGQNNVSGSLVFGISTQGNNGLGSATLFPTDPLTGNFTTFFNGAVVNQCGFQSATGQFVCGFVDSGTNTYSITDPALVACMSSFDSSFNCTAKGYSGLSVQNQGALGSPTESISFTVQSADTLFQNSCCTAYNDLASPSAGNSTWDWGLPFFFGRNVFVAIEGQTVSGQTVSPFVAY